MKRFLPLIGGLITVLIVIVLANIYQGALYYNSTDSLPHGFYTMTKVKNVSDYKRGDIAVFPVPENVSALVNERRWLPPNGHLMKPIVGFENEAVCTDGLQLFVNNEYLGKILTEDAMGRSLPVYSHCGRIEKGHVMVVVGGLSASFDSRNYGPISMTNIIGKAKPLWTF